MKKKLRLYAALLLGGIMGTSLSGVAKAEVTPVEGVTIDYTLNNGTMAFTAGVLEITDGTDTLVILDRNLGATAAGTGCDYKTNGNQYCTDGDETYGYHFQWGNNWGFAPCTGSNNCKTFPNGEIAIKGRAPASQVTSGYSSGVFYYGYNNWIDNNSKIDMWGGSAGDGVYNLTDETRKVTNAVERQGPCPEGFHVPSYGEQSKIINMMGNKPNEIHNKLLIPFSAFRSYIDVSVSSLGYASNLWSSSPSSVSNPRAQRIYMDVNLDLGQGYLLYPLAYSVRCIYNLYEAYPRPLTISFDSQGGEVVEKQYVQKNGTGIKPADPTKTGYDFKYRYQTGNEDTPFDFENTTITENITLYAKREGIEYTITLDLNGGTGIELSKTIKCGDPISLGTPTRGGYRFLGREPALPATMPGENLNVKAIWKKRSSSTGGGGGSSSETNTGSTTNTGDNNTNTGSTSTGTVNTGTTLTGDTQDSSNKSSEGQSGYSQEFIDAYNFAFQNGITTMPTIDQADMTGNLTRIQMAKMLSYYAINIMGKKPDETRNNKFNDVSEKLNSDYNNGVTLAYQLGIMGINMPNNNFRPNDLVTRGEFVTALSRMIYGTDDGEYGGTSKYYTKHIEKLNEEEIIKQIDPSMKELRAYVMIMLKRASEK